MKDRRMVSWLEMEIGDVKMIKWLFDDMNGFDWIEEMARVICRLIEW